MTKFPQPFTKVLFDPQFPSPNNDETCLGKYGTNAIFPNRFHFTPNLQNFNPITPQTFRHCWERLAGRKVVSNFVRLGTFVNFSWKIRASQPFTKF